MKLENIRKLKVWRYSYNSKKEKEEHQFHMLSAQFTIEKEGELWIEFSQSI